MSSLSDYFHTDIEAMTSNDWVGLILTVVIFVLMLVAYVYAFRPKNRDMLEAQKYIPMDDGDNSDSGDKNVG